MNLTFFVIGSGGQRQRDLTSSDRLLVLERGSRLATRWSLTSGLQLIKSRDFSTVIISSCKLGKGRTITRKDF